MFAKLITRDGVPITTSDYSLYLDHSGHEAAEKLIEYLNNQDTLFVITDREHHLIKPIFEDKHNVIVVDLNTCYDKRVSIVNKIKSLNYKRIVTYTIGLTNQGDSETNQLFVHFVQQRLRSVGLEVVSILDDVQSMFTLPRSYSIYDFVLYTGHSLVHWFDCGMIICSNRYDLSKTKLKQNSFVLYKFIQSLDIVLSKIDKIFYLDYVLKTYVKENQLSDYIKFDYNVSPYRIILTCKQIPLELITCQFEYESEFNSVQYNHFERVALFNTFEDDRPVTKIMIRSTDQLGEEQFLKTFFDYIGNIYKTHLVS